MPISVNWSTGVIAVPQSYLTFLSGARYELDVNQLRLDLKALEASQIGMVFDDTHVRQTGIITLSGVPYARLVEFGTSQTYGTSRSSGLPSYTVEFEDVGSPYEVSCVGANHNVADVKVVNQVSLIIGNTAGLIEVATGGGGGGDFTSSDRAVLNLILDHMEADEDFQPNVAIKYRRGTQVELLRKIVNGGNVRAVTLTDP